MSDSTTELNLIQLRRSLQQAALSAEHQIEGLKGFDIPFEVADDVYNWTRWVLQCSDVVLTDDQRSSLVALDALTTRMSGKHNAKLWSHDAIRSRPEWEEVRQRARRILELFGWPMEVGSE